MKIRALPALLAVLVTLGAVVGCSGPEPEAEAPAGQEVIEDSASMDDQGMESEEEPAEPTQRPLPPMDENNILNIAINSPDHSTLVAAVQAADLTTAVAATGPLTLFAPTNAAFEALPPGTVDWLTSSSTT